MWRIIMGKLSDLWKSLQTCPPENVQEIRQQINRTEQWCIDNGFAGIKEITDWTKRDKQKKSYRFESDRHGGHNPPPNAKYGKDRCRACIYNRHVYCNPDDADGHFANV